MFIGSSCKISGVVMTEGRLNVIRSSLAPIDVLVNVTIDE